MVTDFSLTRSVDEPLVVAVVVVALATAAAADTVWSEALPSEHACNVAAVNAAAIASVPIRVTAREQELSLKIFMAYPEGN
jgi:hypothetical protein